MGVLFDNIKKRNMKETLSKLLQIAENSESKFEQEIAIAILSARSEDKQTADALAHALVITSKLYNNAEESVQLG